VDFNRIGLVMAQSAHSVGLNTARVKSLTRPPSSLLTRLTNPNPIHSPHSRDRESSAASLLDLGELRCRLPTPRRAIGPPPWPQSSHRGKSSPSTSLACCAAVDALGRPRVASGVLLRVLGASTPTCSHPCGSAKL
jgi:hypothetical protein